MWLTLSWLLNSLPTRLQEALNQPIHIDDHTFHVSFSIGIAIFPGGASDAETILKYADTAMYEAKAAGRNVTRVFKSGMGKEVRERLSLENDLRRAPKGQEFELYFQPQIDIASGRIIGAESLIRWKHPEKGIVPPDKFIPVAEKSDIIIAIGDWVLKEACNQLKVWDDFPILAVNVSTKQLLRPDFTKQIRDLLEELEIDPQRLELELTETILLADEEATSESMRALKDIGLRISLDDFGTGYSSLSYLKRLPFDSVKIDKSFVFDVTLSPDDAAIVEAIITLGKILKLTVIAEGFENKEQLEFLRSRECAIAQGYYFSPAIPADDFTALIARDASL